MRPDQIARLAELTEKLADVAIEESDPDTWPGAGQPLADVEKSVRGDRYWCKKNAMATVALLIRVDDLATKNGQIRPRDATELDIDKDIAHAEKQAQAIIDRMNAARFPH